MKKACKLRIGKFKVMGIDGIHREIMILEKKENLPLLVNFLGMRRVYKKGISLAGKCS